MTIQDKLRKIKADAIRIEELQNEIKEMEGRMNVQSVKFDSDKVQGSGDNDRLEHQVIRLIELKEKYEKEITKYYSFREQMLDIVHTLTNSNEIAVLYKRYFEFKSFHRISNEMSYCIQHIFTMHDNALQHLKDKSKCDN